MYQTDAKLPEFEFDLSLANQRKVYELLEKACNAINETKRQFGQPVASQLVPPKPTSDGSQAIIRMVPRDRIAAGLLTKGVRTLRAIHCLVDNGHGVDAYTLCRVLIENALVTEWLLCQDEKERNIRLETYIHHFEAFKVRADHIHSSEAAEWGQDPHPPLADERSREISSLLFDDKWIHWAWMSDGKGGKRLVRLREMAAELKHELLYDRWYFDMSQFIHSAPASVVEVAAPDHFDIDTSADDSFLNRAVTLANAFTLSMMTTVDIRYGLGAEFLLKEAQLRSLKLGDDPAGADAAVEQFMQEYRSLRAGGAAEAPAGGFIFLGDWAARIRRSE